MRKMARRGGRTIRKVRCAGKTKSGKACKRMVTPPAKLCYLHKK